MSDLVTAYVVTGPGDVKVTVFCETDRHGDVFDVVRVGGGRTERVRCYSLTTAVSVADAWAVRRDYVAGDVIPTPRETLSWDRYEPVL